jgi:hypothetical protein
MSVYNRHVNRRDGAVAMLKWLEHETDFFTAPASTKFHGARPCGLLVHSLNVYRRLLQITTVETYGTTAVLPTDLAESVVESVAIMGLLHDVCKVNCYHQETKRRKNQDTGKWEDYLGYTFRDPFPLGHGEKSLYLIQRFMTLTDAEAMAIRWHMGAYDDAVKGGSRSMTEAMNLTPWVWRLQEADMCASWEDEREAVE